MWGAVSCVEKWKLGWVEVVVSMIAGAEILEMGGCRGVKKKGQ